MVTIYDIAKKAGVSAATVSKVLNGYPDVSQRTMVKVQKICDDMGYRPNSVARGLATKKSSTIGIFFTDHLNSGFRHPFLQDILASFKEVVGLAGYDLIFFSDDSPNNHLNSFYERARHRNVDGVFLMGVPRTDPNLHNLAHSHLPCIAIDLDLIGPRAGFIMSDNIGGAIKAVNHLVEQGHKEIAFISDVFSTKPGQDRLIGFRAGMQKHQLPVKSEWILNGDFTEQGGYQSANRLLKMEQLPTAIFCAGDMMALGVIRALHENGIQVPGDMSVIGFDDLALLKYVKPGLTTIRQNKEELGKRAGVELLKMMKDANYFPASSALVETELVLRETVTKPRINKNIEWV
ncbi:LacI family DNA-binding transcriptional regulator [Pullulanibacillus sp. KACC 23026]|uniref:LacI family DNA-binding transcriptional regulator n=1 Tax=Pullulanibacillus sp. KACC 23026 TaxID=3028315 RepID=UPI0023B17055|nr:LacI family DNA-binding transcriptional regulator [Pullulanibacillus sp. KACC 23026]WEG11996.1 LacI family DNA-binding transcriptional regulator [Pullulanibacillus sp. KACC 23026]